jgi:hypothetical protein
MRRRHGGSRVVPGEHALARPSIRTAPPSWAATSPAGRSGSTWTVPYRGRRSADTPARPTSSRWWRAAQSCSETGSTFASAASSQEATELVLADLAPAAQAPLIRETARSAPSPCAVQRHLRRRSLLTPGRIGWVWRPATRPGAAVPQGAVRDAAAPLGGDLQRWPGQGRRLGTATVPWSCQAGAALTERAQGQRPARCGCGAGRSAEVRGPPAPRASRAAGGRSPESCFGSAASPG